MGRKTIRGLSFVELFLLGLLSLVSTTAAAQTGAVKGKIVDEQGKPVEKAEILIEFLGGVTRKLTSTSNAKGDFIQIGLTTGNYRLTFQKQGYEPASQEQRVRLGEPLEVGKVVLRKIPEGGKSTAEEAKLGAELKKEFDAGVQASKQGNHQMAIDAFQKVLALAPESADAYFNIGYSYDKLGQDAKALESLQKAVELRGDYYEAYVMMGNILNAKRDWARALQVLEKAIAMRPEETVSLFNYGAIAMNTGDIPKAQAAFEKVVALDPGNALAHYQLAMAYVNQMKNAEAIQALEKYLALDPSGPNAATAQSILQYLKK